MYERPIDYVIEQMDKYDAVNLNIEKSFINSIITIYNKSTKRIMDIASIYGDNMNTLLKMQRLIDKISMEVTSMYTSMYQLFMKSIGAYYKRGYDQMDNLIQIGMEMADKARAIHEMQLLPDNNTIDYMKKHSFEMVKDISNDIINDMRLKLSSLLIQQGYTKENVIDAIQDTMRVKRSRATNIAQTEMSMAYNAGALQRMNEFNQLGEGHMMKYWYGFKYSETTCQYCRPRIGTTYELNDETEHLPAHPRCRCVWLPYVEGWDEPIPSSITRKADMLKRTLKPDEIYNKINNRLGIDYADYISQDIATDYIAGNRSQAVKDAIAKARDNKIVDVMDNFDIVSTSSSDVMSNEFRIQMNFWKEYVAQTMVDNDTKLLRNCYDAIKGIMVLPWTGEQLSKWNNLLEAISSELQ